MNYYEKRFKLFGRAYLLRKRVYKSRPLELIRGECFNALHLWKLTLLWERNNPKRPIPQGFVK